MLEIEQYRLAENVAKSFIGTWRLSQIHNLDHFERVGFPVRIPTLQNLTLLIDTMQENRFQKYITELGGLDADLLKLFLNAAEDVVRYQWTMFPKFEARIPWSTLASALALYVKASILKPKFKNVLEIGPGCGYFSLFLKNHTYLEDYSQIEAAECFYLLQSTLNQFLFAEKSNELAHLDISSESAQNSFALLRDDWEKTNKINISPNNRSINHYPWWKIGDVAKKVNSFDIIMSNANLLEFNVSARADYLKLIHTTLATNGYFLVQCTGYPASGTVEKLLEELKDAGFAQIFFVRENTPFTITGQANKDSSGVRGAINSLLNRSTTEPRNLTVNNGIFVKKGHPLFDKYYGTTSTHFVGSETFIEDLYFKDRGEQLSTEYLTDLLKKKMAA